MRGVVFTELLEFVENALGFDVADKMIEMSKLSNHGAFSQGGNYPFDHMLKLLDSLSKITGKTPNELLYIFGEHLFSILVKLYAKDIKDMGSLEFINSVDSFVHTEVKKLYPDADLPSFITQEKSEKHLVLIYESEKRLEAFAHGLIVACGKYFDETLAVKYEVVSQNPYRVKFLINKE